MIAAFIGPDDEDYYAHLTTRPTSSLMLGAELDRAIVEAVAGGFGSFNTESPRERRIGGGAYQSYHLWDEYSPFAQYQITGVTNSDLKSDEDGLDHLVRPELARSFR